MGADVGCDKTNENGVNKMTTDDLTRTIKKFTSANGRGPKPLQELHEALVAELNKPISDADVREELGKAVEGGFIGKDNEGCFIVL